MTMKKLGSAEDLAREIAEEAEGLELYYQEISSQQLLRRISDRFPMATATKDKTEKQPQNRSSDKADDAYSVNLNWNDELQNSYQSFLDDHAALAKQSTGMKTGVWIDANEFSNGKDRLQATSSEKAEDS